GIMRMGGLLSVGADASEFRIALRAGGRALAVVRAFGLVRPGRADGAAAAPCGSPAGRSAPGKNSAGADAAVGGAEVLRPAETVIGSGGPDAALRFGSGPCVSTAWAAPGVSGLAYRLPSARSCIAAPGYACRRSNRTGAVSADCAPDAP